ncbi:hypothetical protein ASPBRDRAFT_142527 [Aspergillus terreus]|uniref:Uncharacterized protein n=1 Tax=Aspergillus terreus TaxID=33178 RepID=A0A5M3ZFH7_ASPTE|nr:hypothetical protein ATETN484_0013041300 [Aspergillus terreus]GFF20646.1 hypothetical protein ASPBRDRAFT_142527 [Aspergillus terreus]
MRLVSASIAAILATASALKITKPGPSDIVSVSQDWEVCWDYVDSDPNSFCLYLTNYKFYPPQTFYLRGVATNGRLTWPSVVVTGFELLHAEIQRQSSPRLQI